MLIYLPGRLAMTWIEQLFILLLRSITLMPEASIHGYGIERVRPDADYFSGRHTTLKPKVECSPNQVIGE
ncbi:hypothetical protein D3C87_959290 [compost metagenome]